MVKEYLILVVTRMKPPRLCSMVMDQNYNLFRVSFSTYNLTETFLAQQNNGHLWQPENVFELENIRKEHRPTHPEDTIFSPKISFKRNITPDKFWQIVQPIIKNSPDDILGVPLEERNSKQGISPTQKPIASFGIMNIVQPIGIIFNIDFGKLRGIVSDNNHKLYDLPITSIKELSLWEANKLTLNDNTPAKAVFVGLANQFIAQGQTTPFCYLQICGIVY